jgi:NADPH:quinone reductase-like Zn-dependent oxidoreductase
MKAIVYTEYGEPDVLKLKDVEKPSPKDGEVLLRIRATSLNAYDLRFLRADPFLIRLMSGGLFRPIYQTLGADAAGRVEEIGPNVTRFTPGDEVFGEIGSGGLAEYARAREGSLSIKPAGMTFEQAAAIPMAALTALQGLRDHGRIRAGQKVLIHGAGGGVGTFAVQIAKAFGAEVTAVCGPETAELARSLGADRVVDYSKENVARQDRCFDLILAVNGYRSIFEYRRMLNPGGIYLMAGGALAQILEALILGPVLSRAGGRKTGSYTARTDPRDLEFLAELFTAGKVKPVIDRRYPLSEAPDAFRYLARGHTKGKVVITLPVNGEAKT